MEFFSVNCEKMVYSLGNREIYTIKNLIEKFKLNDRESGHHLYQENFVPALVKQYRGYFTKRLAVWWLKSIKLHRQSLIFPSLCKERKSTFLG